MAATTVLCARFRESFDRMGNFVSHTDGQPERQEGRREGRHSKLYRTEALVRPSVVRPPVSREGRRGREGGRPLSRLGLECPTDRLKRRASWSEAARPCRIFFRQF